MLIYLYGSDTYRRGRYLADLRGKYAAKHSVYSAYEFDFSSGSGLRELCDLCAAQSLFALKKFIVLRNPFSFFENEARQYKKFLEGLIDEPDIILTIVTDGLPPKTFAFLQKKARITKAFPVPVGAAFEQFVREEASRCGAKLTPKLLRELSTAFAGDTWGVAAELQKIALGGTYAATPMNGISDFFAALMALRRNSMEQALPILERLLQREDPTKLFNVLAASVSLSEKIRFADYDILLKIGKMDYALALTDYVLGQRSE